MHWVRVVRNTGFEMKTIRTISSALFILLLASSAQAQQTWTRTYGGSGDDVGYSVQQTKDGGYIVAGYTTSFGAGGADMYLIKTDASGDTIWTGTYGGRLADYGYSVQQTTDGGYIIAGSTNSFGSGGTHAYLVKTNATGDTMWTKFYGGKNTCYVQAVRQTSDGGYIAAGNSTTSSDTFWGDVYLIKTNASGDTLWTKTYGGNSLDYANSVQQTTDGGYIVAGYTASFGAGGSDVYLIKTNADGDSLWTRTYGGAQGDYASSVQQTSDSGYIIAGKTYSFGAGSGDVWLIKTNAAGDTLWTKTYGGTENEGGYSVQQTKDGGYIVAGYTNSFGAGEYDVYLIKTDAYGDTLWTKTYGGTGDDEGYSVRQTSDGGYILAGYTNSFGAGGADGYLIKTDANGYAGIEEPGNSRQKTLSGMKATPNPFASFTRIPGHETQRFDVYDISGKLVGTYRGSRIGEGLLPALYFIRLEGGRAGCVRVVKVK
jgi:hypothetical protein